MENKNHQTDNAQAVQDSFDPQAELTEVVDKTSEVEDSAEEINNLRDKVVLLEDRILRISAESENTRKRYEKMTQEARDYAVTSFAKDLLSVMDNLSRALEYKSDKMDHQMTNIVTGIEMTKDELTNLFRKHGLESVAPEAGEEFDYNIHHVISQVVTDEYNPGNIMEVTQIGYKLKDRLLRPAIVKVAKKPD